MLLKVSMVPFFSVLKSPWISPADGHVDSNRTVRRFGY